MKMKMAKSCLVNVIMIYGKKNVLLKMVNIIHIYK